MHPQMRAANRFQNQQEQEFSVMPALHAYAISGALVASIATWAFLQFPGILIWCAVIGWACFLHSGGSRSVLGTVSACLVFGVTSAWAFALIVSAGYITLPLPVTAAILVAMLAPFIILMSKLSILSVIPASFYGFASCFAYIAQTPERFTLQAMTSLSLENTLIVVSISLLIGVGLGFVQTLIASRMITEPPMAAKEN
jgi:hypothetical protein